MIRLYQPARQSQAVAAGLRVGGWSNNLVGGQSGSQYRGKARRDAFAWSLGVPSKHHVGGRTLTPHSVKCPNLRFRAELGSLLGNRLLTLLDFSTELIEPFGQVSWCDLHNVLKLFCQVFLHIAAFLFRSRHDNLKL